MRPRSGCATLKLVQGLVVAPVVRGLARRDAWRGVVLGISAGPRADREADMHLSIDTILPADSVEFCPHPDASNIFVCGTYKLQEEQKPSHASEPANAGQNQIRTGQCLVFEVDSEQEQETISACVPLIKLFS